MTACGAAGPAVSTTRRPPRVLAPAWTRVVRSRQDEMRCRAAARRRTSREWWEALNWASMGRGPMNSGAGTGPRPSLYERPLYRWLYIPKTPPADKFSVLKINSERATQCRFGRSSWLWDCEAKTFNCASLHTVHLDTTFDWAFCFKTVNHVDDVPTSTDSQTLREVKVFYSACCVRACID